MKRLMILLALVAPSLPWRAPAVAQSPSSFRLVVDWEMQPRFGLDANRDGRIDLPNTKEYVHNRSSSCFGPCPEPRFHVTLEAHAEVDGTRVEIPVRRYQWEIDGPALDSPYSLNRTRPTASLLLGEGDYDIDLRALVPIPWGQLTLRTRRSMTVDDLLVVAIGDSYAAGEGNPERPREPGGDAALWADGTGPAESEHAAAHRSTVAWPARVALSLEQLDRHTSVTFVSLAETGARIDRGVAGPMGDGDRSQVEEVSAMVGERRIDLLLTQVGGNDVGFARIVEALVDADPQLDPICYETMLQQALDAFHDGDWRRGTRVRYSFPFRLTCRETTESRGLVVPGWDGLKDAFARLSRALDRLDAEKTVLVGYPDPTGAAVPGEQCDEIVGDTLRPLGFHEVDAREQELGVKRVLQPLNAALQSAATRHGWQYVDGVAEAFDGHGYCAPWPDYGYPDEYHELPGFLRRRLDFPEGWYRNPGSGSPPLLVGGLEVSWYRTASQSSALQGPGAAFATSGTLHPNEVGQAAIARLVLRSLGD